MAKMPMKSKKSGKRMNFSQAVIGTTATRTRKATPGTKVAGSAGTVGKPMRNKGGKVAGRKRVF